MSVWDNVKTFLGQGLPGILDTPPAYQPRGYVAYPERLPSNVAHAGDGFTPMATPAAASISHETWWLIGGGVVALIVVLRMLR